MKQIYQLTAEGPSVNGWPFKLASHKVFLSKKAAEDYIEAFKDLCCNPSYFDYCDDRDKLQVRVLELELQEEIV